MTTIDKRLKLLCKTLALNSKTTPKKYLDDFAEDYRVIIREFSDALGVDSKKYVTYFEKRYYGK